MSIQQYQAINESNNQLDKHDKRSQYFERCGQLCIVSVTLCAIVYFVRDFYDEKRNITVHTDIEANASSIETPYFYFSCLNASELDIRMIKMFHYNEEEPDELFNLSVYNASDFTYNNKRKNWSVIYLNESHILTNGMAKQLLVIPSTENGNHIDKRDSLMIGTFVQKNTSDPLRDFWSGIFWAVDSMTVIQQNINADNIEKAFGKRFGSTFFQHQYATFAANTETSLEVIIEKDDRKWPFRKQHYERETYYKANVNADVHHESFTDTLNHNNSFYFFINPTGAGVRTVVTTEKEHGKMDVLSSIGGVFSPTISITLFLVNIVIFGVNCGKKECCGYAKRKRLSKIEKDRIKEYLKELDIV